MWTPIWQMRENSQRAAALAYRKRVRIAQQQLASTLWLCQNRAEVTRQQWKRRNRLLLCLCEL